VKAEIKNKLAIGKRNEFAIWGYLLGEGFDVFPSLVDDKGIDGIVGHEGRYFEVQIKSGENWNNQRGLSRAAVSVNPDRIFLIYNTVEDEVRYFTGRQILDEAECKSPLTTAFPKSSFPSGCWRSIRPITGPDSSRT
jgi:hypothetical protein